ncbi:hypothetical protein V5E97_29355 [Singulisphaera sp. Ch08]|uniref:Uncharacterized protein n=1 Tax=Singulisphaera sp. Ch08 TaxID=3120278 RepID=A0AAU7CBM1_9BACT
MKDIALVVPILIAGGTVLVSISSSSWNNGHPNHTQNLAFLAFLFGLLYAWHRGKQAAAERMKALELGWSPPSFSSSSSIGRGTLTAGMFMPVSLLGVAWLASVSRPDLSTPIWSAASLLGMTTLICGTILLLRQPSLSSFPEPTRQRGVVLKSTADPDEFDVVSQRGSNGHPSETRT